MQFVRECLSCTLNICLTNCIIPIRTQFREISYNRCSRYSVTKVWISFVLWGRVYWTSCYYPHYFFSPVIARCEEGAILRMFGTSDNATVGLAVIVRKVNEQVCSQDLVLRSARNYSYQLFFFRICFRNNISNHACSSATSSLAQVWWRHLWNTFLGLYRRKYDATRWF